MHKKVSIYFLSVFLTLFTSGAFAQLSSNYTFNAVTNASLTDMSSGTTDILIPTSASGDFASTVQNIGFNFTFMGTTYTQFSVNSNGLMRLGPAAVSTAYSNDLNIATNMPQIAPFWDDLNQAVGITKAHMKVTGSPGSQVLTVEWKDFVLIYSSTSTTELSSFQARLYEATGVIEFVYGSMVTATGSGTVTASIGFSTANANDKVASVTSVTTPAVAYTTAGVVNNLINSSVVGPIAGLHSTADGERVMYSFTPPSAVNAAPTGLSFTSVTGSGMTLNWTDNATNESGYLINRSVDGVSYTLVGTTGVDAVSFNATGLFPGTTYHWRVQAFNEGSVSAFLSGSQASSAPGGVVSAGSGNWSSTTPDAPWPGGVVPAMADNVTISAGHTVVLDAAGLECHNLTVAGTLEYQATPLAGLTVNGNVTVSSGGTFSAGSGSLTTHTLVIGSTAFGEEITGDLINNGTFDLNTTAGVTTTFRGGLNASISGSGSAPDFWAITVNKGTTRDGATLEVLVPITMSVVNSSTVRLNLTNGTFKLSSASDITPAGGTQNIIAAGGRLWLNHAGAVYNGVFAGSPTVIGELRIDAGTFNYGSGNNTLTFSSTAPGGVLTMNGGTINFYGAVSFSSAAGVVFNMSGGNFNVDPQHTNNSAASTIFSIGISTTLNWSGGTITIVDPRSTAGSTAFQNSTGSGKVITGGKLRLGDGVSTASGGTLSNTSGFGISATAGIWDLEIDNRADASTSRMARITGTTYILNQLEIKENGYVFLGSSTTGSFLAPIGNVINNGTIAGTEPGGSQHIGTFYWLGMGPQTLSGNGTFVNIPTMSVYNLGSSFRFSDLEHLEANEQLNREADLSGEVREHLPIAKLPEGILMSTFSNTVTLSNTNPFVVNRVNGFSGTINPGSNFTIGKAGVSIPIVQVGGGDAVDPGGSFTSVPQFDNTQGFSTYIYATALGAHTTGAYNEMPAGPQTWTQVLINDADGLILDRAITVNNFMTLTLGTINTTSSNLLTFLAQTSLTGIAASYINGPFARQINAETTAGTTFNFPIGKGEHRPLALVDPVTTSDGPAVVTAEVFDANSGGTPGTGMISLNTNRYWSASATSGASNLSSTKVRLTEDPLNVTDGIAKSSTVGGVYNLVSSTLPSGGTITSDEMASLSFFNIGERFTGPPNPTDVTASGVSASQINIAFTPNGASNNVVIVWNLSGTFTVPSGAPVVGDPLAGGTVLSNGTASPVNHTGLTGTTKYYYKAFSYDGVDYSIGVEVNASTWGSLPYTQDFEGTFPPTAWDNYGTKLWTLSNTGGVGGSKAARVSYTPAGTANLQTPVFVLPASPDHRAKFAWKDNDISTEGDNVKGGTNGPEIIGQDTTYFEITTDGGANWTVLAFLSAASPQSNYVNEEINLSAYAGETVSFRWRDESNGTFSAYGTGVDDVKFEEIPSCTEPSALTATGITTTSANLGWTENGSATSWDIEYGPTPFTPTGTPSVSGVTNPYNLSGLTASTGYAYYVRASCGGIFSPWVGPYNFNTLCDVIALPFSESFDDVTFPPICWTRINAGSGNNWARGTTAYAGAGAMQYTYNTSFAANSWMITPGFNLESGKTYIVTFYQRVQSASYPEKLKVTVGTAPDVVSQTTVIWDNAGGANLLNTTYEERTANFTAPSTGTYYFGFNVYSDADMWNLHVDEISIVEASADDIGVISLSLDETDALNQLILTSGLSRQQASELEGNELEKQLTISAIKLQNPLNTEGGPVSFEATVQNFGSDAQNSYQVGWEIDGVVQTPVSNTDPLAPGATDVIVLTWSTPDAGLHSVRAWSILAGDTNPLNDTSGTLSFYVTGENSVFFEGFNGSTFPPTGWTALNQDGGGTTGPWFQGNPAVFTAFEGPGYAGANYAGANGFYIDEWLITPNTGGLSRSGSDSLIFWVISPYNPPPGDNWPDSLQIRVSTTGTDPADFTTVLDYINVPKGQWTRFAYPLPSAASRYIAFRYLIYNGGINGDNSDYVGLDAVEITSEGGSSTFELTVDVTNGWNMVSIPGLHPVNQNVDTWWPNRNTLGDVYKWSGGYQSVTTAAPTEGYWMIHTGDQTYNSGDEWPAINTVAHDPIAVFTGWNLIGAYDQNLLVSELTTTPPGLIVPGTVYGWNGTYYSPTNLEPGYGYWVLLSGDGVINAEPTEGGTAAKQDDKEDWGRITVTDASGKRYTLYSVNGEVNLDHYQMPPFPPTGSFDVRYSSGRKAEDLKSGSQMIEMRGMEYPVTVSVENANIKLQDETGKSVNARLKPGEEIKINSSQINKLIVSENIIPDVYSLEQNYPNPFNPSTIIQFSIPEDAKNVRLTIYNALGQRVAELVNGSFEAGIYQYHWNAVDFASGLYIYELRTEKFSSVKKMMLLK